jgi:hypothetical protein
LKTIYGVQANVQKSPWYSVWIFFFETWSSQHAQKRKVIAQALTDRSLDLIDSVMLQHTRIFCKLLVDSEESDSAIGAQDWSTARNVQKLISQLSFDVMGDICFGHSFQMMVNSTNHYIFGNMKEGGRCLYAVRILHNRCHFEASLT